MSAAFSLERLDDYVTETMSTEEAFAFEEALFESPEDGVVAWFDRTQRLLSWLVTLGGLSGGGTAKDVEQLKADGYRVHVVELDGAGGNVSLAPWGDDVDVVVFRTLVDARPFEDVECAVETASGTPIKTFRGILCDPTTGNVYAICAPPLAKMAYGTERRISRMTGVRDGRRETIVVIDSSPA